MVNDHRRQLADIAREIEIALQRTETLGLRILYRRVCDWMAKARDDSDIHPHQRAQAQRVAARCLARYDANVERILMQRLQRGAYTLTGPEQPRRQPPSKEAA